MGKAHHILSFPLLSFLKLALEAICVSHISFLWTLMLSGRLDLLVWAVLYDTSEQYFGREELMSLQMSSWWNNTCTLFLTRMTNSHQAYCYLEKTLSGKKRWVIGCKFKFCGSKSCYKFLTNWFQISSRVPVDIFMEMEHAQIQIIKLVMFHVFQNSK